MTNVLILRAPGTNCDGETAHAFELAGGRPQILHVQRVLESPRLFDNFQVLCLPGGFSYGDDLAAGRILGVQLRLHLAEALQAFKAAGKLILGICNGFQILMRSGLLLEDDAQRGPAATLTNNASGKFEDRWVRLSAEPGKCVFLQGVREMYLPVAHAEGKFVARDERSLGALQAAGQLVLRYESQYANGAEVAYPDNPNGSVAAIAGICDTTGRVWGLMPHPERFVDPTQHPRWTRGEAGDEGDGLQVFRNAVQYFQ